MVFAAFRGGKRARGTYEIKRNPIPKHTRTHTRIVKVGDERLVGLKSKFKEKKN